MMLMSSWIKKLMFERHEAFVRKSVEEARIKPLTFSLSSINWFVRL